MKLSLSALARLPAGVAPPGHDPRRLTPGILHFGVGNFHRAHQAVYLDDLFGRGLDQDWAIVGAGVMAGDAKGRALLEGQDWLTTVVDQEADGVNARVTAAMVDYLDPTDRAAIVSRLADPAIRIVSLTITEGGYFVDPASGRFDPDHPAIRADAASLAGARTVFGLMLAGLKVRRAAGVPAFTVMSCDNVPGNGHVTHDALVGLAGLADPGLADWVRENVAFPNGMVDRITPATTDRERQWLRDTLGLDDGWPVFCEGFRQWVLEDDFPTGRPALEQAGVEFVDDVTPYETMKIRILNGGHAVIAYPAALLDIHFVHEAMADPLISAFLRRIQHEEIMPVVEPPAGMEPRAYFLRIEQRFANPRIGDTVSRLCLDGSNRQPKFILPTVADRLAKGLDVAGLALVSALWCRYCHGETDSGRAIAPNDPNWDRLQAAAHAARGEPAAWLAMEDIYGDTANVETFRRPFAAALKALWQRGTKDVLQHYVESGNAGEPGRGNA